MAITVCWAAKGGSGTTVVAAALALAARPTAARRPRRRPARRARHRPTRPARAWPTGSPPTRPPGALDDLAVDVDRTTRLLPRGAAAVDRDAPRWPELARVARRSDAGRLRRRRHRPAAAGARRADARAAARHPGLLPLAAPGRALAVPPRRRRARRRARPRAARRSTSSGRSARRWCTRSAIDPAVAAGRRRRPARRPPARGLATRLRGAA